MAIHSDKRQKDTTQTTTHAVQNRIRNHPKAFPLEDNRAESLLQIKFQEQVSNASKSSFPSTVIQKQCDNPNCTNKSCKGNECNAPRPMAPYDPKQKHLAKRALVQKGKPTMVIAEDFDGKHGMKSMKNNKLDKKKYREPQIQHHQGYGGTGLDEMISTATTKKYIDKLPVKDRMKSVHKLSQSRIETAKLMWGTGLPKYPISGHPGSLSKSQTDMRKGLTKGHGSRDRARAKAVKTELGNQKINFEKAHDNAKVRSQVETIKHFMKPYQELIGIDVSKAKDDVYHPQFGRIVHKGKKIQPNYRRSIKAMHHERERLKIETAKMLVHYKKPSLVSPQMINFLNGKYLPKKGMKHSLAHSLDKDKTLDEHEQMNTKLPQNKRIRAVSPPRLSPNYYPSIPDVNVGKKKPRQTTMDDFFFEPPHKKRKLNSHNININNNNNNDNSNNNNNSNTG